MGEHVNRRRTTLTAGALAAIISALNVFLICQFIA
jgi:Mn2+/Fe2+ NRAMP family transporter